MDHRVRRSGSKTRERILDAAERIFAELDYSAARLEDVARAVGIRRASIIYYFPTKHDLYEAVQETAYSKMASFVRRRIDVGDSHSERLLALLDATLDFLVARPTLARIILRDCVTPYEDADVAVRYSRRMLELWDRVVTEGQAAGAIVEAPPVFLMDALGSGIMFFAATAGVIGSTRHYDPAAPEQLEIYRKLMHAAARSALRESGEPT